mmetsp:Transcript_119713/g.267424  ORF Transcript_119713/g.267424 Transcript_119713/m.267424 type:complete len:203 (-) Transcript_119713:37-645(-)
MQWFKHRNTQASFKAHSWKFCCEGSESEEAAPPNCDGKGTKSRRPDFSSACRAFFGLSSNFAMKASTAKRLRAISLISARPSPLWLSPPPTPAQAPVAPKAEMIRVRTVVLRCTKWAGTGRSTLGASRKRSTTHWISCSSSADRRQSASKDNHKLCTVSACKRSQSASSKTTRSSVPSCQVNDKLALSAACKGAAALLKRRK